MNRQYKGPGRRGIEWTDWTWNPTAGCLHGCTWRMPDGSTTECYAKTIAEGIASSAYDRGFEHHYWRPHFLNAPLRVSEPGRVFVGSMADLFGHWVPDGQIDEVLEVMRSAHWHTFQTLSKYPVRLADFNPYPDNVWVGVSLPAGHMMSATGAARALRAFLGKLTDVEARVRFLSIEPLWFDAGAVLARWADENGSLPVEWAIIGAASKGRHYYQPERNWVHSVLEVLDDFSVPIFFKGNLEWSPWREEFPPDSSEERALLRPSIPCVIPEP